MSWVKFFVRNKWCIFGFGDEYFPDESYQVRHKSYINTKDYGTSQKKFLETSSYSETLSKELIAK